MAEKSTGNTKTGCGTSLSIYNLVITYIMQKFSGNDWSSRFKSADKKMLLRTPDPLRMCGTGSGYETM